MGMNIKTEEAHRLARTIADLTEENLTEAVTVALQERLARLTLRTDEAVTARILRIGRECSVQLKEPYRSADHADLLYGPDGLPR